MAITKRLISGFSINILSVRRASILSVDKSKSRPKYVPTCPPPSEDMVTSLQNFIDKHRKVVVLTGAGVSTESGIPDYRSEKVGLYARKNYKPMQYQEFVKSAAKRRRYWARSYIGWRGYSKILPSENHKLLAMWEKTGLIHWLITQNVDHLHTIAGSSKVTELHGTLHNVKCLGCNAVIHRQVYQSHIEQFNPNWTVDSFEVATDGDVFLTDKQIEGFRVPECQNCMGVMMPQIVFFGDNVPSTTVSFLKEKVAESDSLLVLGSSLQVYSGYRFVLTAAELKKPIAIINIGDTRADKHATLKLDARCSDVLRLISVT